MKTNKAEENNQQYNDKGERIGYWEWYWDNGNLHYKGHYKFIWTTQYLN